MTLTNRLVPPQGQTRAVSLCHTNLDLLWVPSEWPLGKDPDPWMSRRFLFLFLFPQAPSPAFTHHWGSEKGRTSLQVCKEGGKLVFSQGSTHRKGACASCLNQNEFRNHSDVWFVRHRVGRGVLFVNRNYDFTLAGHGLGRQPALLGLQRRPTASMPETWPFHTSFFFFFYLKKTKSKIKTFITSWLAEDTLASIYLLQSNMKMGNVSEIICQLSLDCASASCVPLRLSHEEIERYPSKQGRYPFLPLEIFCKSYFCWLI